MKRLGKLETTQKQDGWQCCLETSSPAQRDVDIVTACLAQVNFFLSVNIEHITLKESKTEHSTLKKNLY